MSDDREKLIKVMESLESDYRTGKISAEKYSYFRSKYEDKLNSIDAKAATKRIRSMQGKSSPADLKKNVSKKSTRNKKREEQDLVQKYIINPKKSDAKYNKKKRSAMDSGTFKLLLILILVVGFTAGTAYGIFNLDFGSLSEADSVAIVSDTAFPEVKEVVTVNNTYNSTGYSNYSSYDSDDSDEYEVTETIETTTDDSSYDQSYDTDSYQDTQQSEQSTNYDGSESSSNGDTNGNNGN